MRSIKKLIKNRIFIKYLAAWLATTAAAITLYFIIYLVTVFIEWDLYNPFWWIIEIPTGTEDFRANVVSIYAFYIGVKYMFIEILVNPKSNGRPKR